MTNEGQKPLFSETPEGAYRLPNKRTWRDDMMDEVSEVANARDEHNRLDDQGQQTASQIQSRGMSRRQANNLLNAKVASNILRETRREQAKIKQSKDAERSTAQTEEIISLLGDINPDKAA